MGNKSIDKVRKKLTFTYDLISTSYHEASHTLYALLHFTKVPLVYVFENKKNKRIEGFCHYEPIKKLSDIKNSELLALLLKFEICLKYAGLVSERYHFKNISGSDKFPVLLKDGSSNDLSSAADLIKEFNLSPPGKTRYSYKKKLMSQTLSEIKEYWDDIILIAHGLFNRKRLNFLDLEQILTKKSSNKIFWKKQFKIINYISTNCDSLSEDNIKLILTNKDIM